MLHELLQRIAKGGAHSYKELAEALSVPVPLLEAMLEEMARLGYLRSLEAACNHNCHRCPVGGCSVAGRGQVWVLTEKGSRAAG